MRLSASQLSTWLICPQKWYLERVQKWESRMGSSVPVGGALNDAILAYLAERMMGIEHEVDFMLERGMAAFRESWEKTPLFLPRCNPAEEHTACEEKLRKAILCWHANLRTSVDPIALEERWSIHDGDLEILCYLDCREAAWITDWKFKGSTPREEIVHYDHQLTTYYWALRNEIENPPSQVRLMGVVGLKTPKAFELRSSRTEDDIEQLRMRFHAMMGDIQEGRFEPAHPVFSNFCGPTQCCHWDNCPYGRRAYSAFTIPKESSDEF